MAGGKVSARITNKLPAFADEVVRKATRAITAVTTTGAAHASVFTPIATSTLINSQFKRIIVQDGKVIGIVGYTADYAAPVHSPNVKQTFRRATAKKEFLRLGFVESFDLLRSIVEQEMKT